MSAVNPGLNPTVVSDPMPATPVIDSALPSDSLVDAAHWRRTDGTIGERRAVEPGRAMDRVRHRALLDDPDARVAHLLGTSGAGRQDVRLVGGLQRPQFHARQLPVRPVVLTVGRQPQPLLLQLVQDHHSSRDHLDRHRLVGRLCVLVDEVQGSRLAVRGRRGAARGAIADGSHPVAAADHRWGPHRNT